MVLSLVPGGLTEASYALGGSQWRTVRLVTLPTVRSGLATAVILGAARAIGETAPVLLTAGATNYVNFDPTHNAMMSLPLLAYILVQSALPERDRPGLRGSDAAARPRPAAVRHRAGDRRPGPGPADRRAAAQARGQVPA